MSDYPGLNNDFRDLLTAFTVYVVS